ncbi:DNA repair protein RadC [Vibrio harveyi]|uniref:RadC family protein n=1 Tax=Vibrio harveyi TaxID=669 RepID=UPI0008420238|nr:DNA repair protein RadC [Vibrio harveyi]ODM57001.1 DNA repair protein RadC [Vibrio harveyi]
MSFELNETTGKYIVTGELSDEQIVEMANEISRNKFSKGQFLTSPSESREYLQNLYQGYEREVFVVVFLDNQHRVITSEEMFVGTINASSVYPREVVKTALKHNAASLVAVHNHPSGDPEPSQADRRITRRLIDALSLVDIRVLDHIVVGTEGSTSFAERGWI